MAMPRRLPALGHDEGPLLELESRAHGLDGVLGVLERHVVERHDAIADVLVDSAAVPEDDLGHLRQVLAQHLGHLLRLQLLGQRREAADIGEEDGHQPPTGRQAALLLVAHDLADHRRGKELR